MYQSIDFLRTLFSGLEMRRSKAAEKSASTGSGDNGESGGVGIVLPVLEGERGALWRERDERVLSRERVLPRERVLSRDRVVWRDRSVLSVSEESDEFDEHDLTIALPGLGLTTTGSSCCPVEPEPPEPDSDLQKDFDVGKAVFLELTGLVVDEASVNELVELCERLSSPPRALGVEDFGERTSAS